MALESLSVVVGGVRLGDFHEDFLEFVLIVEHSANPITRFPLGSRNAWSGSGLCRFRTILPMNQSYEMGISDIAMARDSKT